MSRRGPGSCGEESENATSSRNLQAAAQCCGLFTGKAVRTGPGGFQSQWGEEPH